MITGSVKGKETFDAFTYLANFRNWVSFGNRIMVDVVLLL